MRLLLAIATWICLLAPSPFFPNTRGASEKQGANETRAKPVPVVVELFTSEGCSSCPPADTLLAKLEEQQPIAGAEVIALEEHVDYWDREGWQDPYSSEQWTERQKKYAAIRRDEGVYTPQMVINGQAEFVGSRERQAREQIHQAAGQAGAEISAVPVDSGKKDTAQFKVTVGALPSLSSDDSAEVWLAVTETGLHSAVTRGENAGRELHHAAIVRVLHKIGSTERGKEPSFTGQAAIKLEHGWNRQNLRAVIFVQEKRKYQILGSTVAPIAP
jgi:hypothetical protein